MFRRKKKSIFSEIVFTDKYYCNGVNIFDDHNRKQVKSLDIQLGFRVSFNQLKDSVMYHVKGKTHNFRLVISEVRDFKIVSFMNVWEFTKARRNQTLAQQSSKINKNLQRDLARSLIKDRIKPCNEVYSISFNRKAIIKEIENSYQVEYYVLLTEDPMNFHFYDGISKDNFYYWEKETGVSYYQKLEDAKKEIDLEFSKPVDEFDVFPDHITIDERLLEETYKKEGFDTHQWKNEKTR